MCGNFNGDPEDDFIGKDKRLHENALEFAMSWQRGRQSICEVGFTQEQVNSSNCKYQYRKKGNIVWGISCLMNLMFHHNPG